MAPPASASPSNRLLPIAMLALIGLLWGLFYVLIKIGYSGGNSF